MRLGIIGSSGGSALAAADACLVEAGHHQDWVVIADRECGLLSWARSHNHAATLVPYESEGSFSRISFELLSVSAVESVLLFYTRRVSRDLWGRIETVNIHPALLPRHPGLHAVKRAVAHGDLELGATLHRVDDGLDSGEILAQVVSPMPGPESSLDAERVSFLQKVWLTLSWWQNATQGTRSYRNPLSPTLDLAFLRLAEHHGAPTPPKALPA